MRILLVEDDLNLGEATKQGLREQFAVDWVLSAEKAEIALSTTNYDLLVLDINLPGISGLELLKKRKNKGDQTPVLLLTAKDAIDDKVKGLNLGADDYLVKPFDLNELIARCNALIRRSSIETKNIIKKDDLYYELATGLLKKSQEVITLSAREKAIFDCLVLNPNRLISKDLIIEKIYDWENQDIESNTIEVHIASLRKKIGKEIISTIRGVGYRINL